MEKPVIVTNDEKDTERFLRVERRIEDVRREAEGKSGFGRHEIICFQRGIDKFQGFLKNRSFNFVHEISDSFNQCAAHLRENAVAIFPLHRIKFQAKNIDHGRGQLWIFEQRLADLVLRVVPGIVLAQHHMDKAGNPTNQVHAVDRNVVGLLHQRGILVCIHPTQSPEGLVELDERNRVDLDLVTIHWIDDEMNDRDGLVVAVFKLDHKRPDHLKFIALHQQKNLFHRLGHVDIFHADRNPGRRRIGRQLNERVRTLVGLHVTDHAVGQLQPRRSRIQNKIIVQAFQITIDFCRLFREFRQNVTPRDGHLVGRFWVCRIHLHESTGEKR